MAYEPADSERTLVEGCLRGDRRSQQQLYEKFYPKMLGVALRYTRDRDEALDILQEGYIKVFGKLDTFGWQCPLEAWVRRVMVNASIDRFRRQAVHNPATASLDNVPESGTDETISGELGAEELMKLIQRLPDGYRMVFNLYAIEGFSHKEIGEQLGINEGTSKSQLSKARAYLQKLLKNQEVDQ